MPADGDRHGVVFGDHRDLQNEGAVAEIGRELHPPAEGPLGRQLADQRAGAVVEVGEPGQPVQAVALPCRWEMVGQASEVEPTATEQAAPGHHGERAPGPKLLPRPTVRTAIWVSMDMTGYFAAETVVMLAWVPTTAAVGMK
jgi:hypothetical protein